MAQSSMGRFDIKSESPIRFCLRIPKCLKDKNASDPYATNATETELLEEGKRHVYVGLVKNYEDEANFLDPYVVVDFEYENPRFPAWDPNSEMHVMGIVEEEIATSAGKRHATEDEEIPEMFSKMSPSLDLVKSNLKDKHKPLFEHKHHSIDIPDYTYGDSPRGRLLKEEQDQNLRGNMAMLCTGVSAQNMLSLVGGSGSMSIPQPIFYSIAAANAIAFFGSSLALLLLKKKPYAAGLFEIIGFASAIVTFLLMMNTFMPWM